MAEQQRRTALRAAARLSEACRDLMQSADELGRPSDSCFILGNILDTVRSLEVTLAQLAEWHRSTEAGRHFHEGHESSTIGVMTAIAELGLAVQQADDLQETISRAYGGSAVVQWLEEAGEAPKET